MSEAPRSVDAVLWSQYASHCWRFSVLLPAILRQTHRPMSSVELNDALFAKLAGWEAVKQARGLLAGVRVLNSDWQPPLLKGTVQ